MRTSDLTKPTSATASILTATSGCTRPNRALAEQLAVTHRQTYELFVPFEDIGPLSPEEKLLRAIFDERADGEVWATEVGQTVYRGEPLITAREKVFFNEAENAEVEDVRRITTDLPAGIREHVTVTLRWAGPLTVGDSLVTTTGEALGVIDGIVDDGASEPRLYLSGGGRGETTTARIERKLPSAAQRMLARGIGPYDPITDVPLTGATLTLEQLTWLAESGGRPLLSEISAYTHANVALRAIAFEKLVRLESLDDGFTATNPTSPYAIAAPPPPPDEDEDEGEDEDEDEDEA